MNALEIKVFANFREICGAKIVTVDATDGDSILAVLKQLITLFPKMKDELFTDQYELKPMNHVFINGKNIMYLEGLQTTVSKKDKIALFPPVAGG
ncbi:ubiquitin-like small modifier protein 1 [Alkalihalobacillus sp. LMS39]|uniref:ubiquitin-like small modifier protein 1 n=1 Tax=Alkalihalobacillus sp. LMS39 TaxID=2924032 RepID=UPI003261716C